MADIWVDSTKTGGNDDGTTKADAFLTFGQAWSAWTSGDVIKVSTNHAETSATTLTYGADVMSASDPCVVYSWDFTGDAYQKATSPQIRVTGTNADLDFDDAVAAFGLYLQVDDGDHVITMPWMTYAVFRDCTFRWSNGSTMTTSRLLTTSVLASFFDCAFINNDDTYAFYGSPAIFRNCTWTGLLWNGQYFFRAAENAPLVGCDFSGATGWGRLNMTDSPITVVGCKFPSGEGVTQTTGSFSAVASQSVSAADGASTAKGYIAEVKMMGGTVVPDTAIYRTAGFVAADGDTPLSHKMTPSSTLKGPHTPFHGPDLFAYVSTTGSKTFTIYAEHDFTTAPNKDECWPEILYLGTTNSLLLSFGGGRIIGSTTAWTVGSEAWTGTSKTKMELSATLTVNKAGFYMARVHLAKYEAGKALWYCPKVEVT
jgi:hypothetical protein